MFRIRGGAMNVRGWSSFQCTNGGSMGECVCGSQWPRALVPPNMIVWQVFGGASSTMLLGMTWGFVMCSGDVTLQCAHDIFFSCVWKWQLSLGTGIVVESKFVTLYRRITELCSYVAIHTVDGPMKWWCDQKACGWLPKRTSDPGGGAEQSSSTPSREYWRPSRRWCANAAMRRWCTFDPYCQCGLELCRC